MGNRGLLLTWDARDVRGVLAVPLGSDHPGQLGVGFRVGVRAQDYPIVIVSSCPPSLEILIDTIRSDLQSGLQSLPIQFHNILNFFDPIRRESVSFTLTDRAPITIVVVCSEGRRTPCEYSSRAHSRTHPCLRWHHTSFGSLVTPGISVITTAQRRSGE